MKAGLSCSVVALSAFLSANGYSAPAISDQAKAEEYIAAVRTFADKALTHGRDEYGSIKSPLFADGINVDTLEPVKWKTGDKEWVICNLGFQQVFFRTLAGLSSLTVDPKYKDAAKKAIAYSFDNLVWGNGLLPMGGHMAYNLTDHKYFFSGDRKVLEYKSVYPYYDLMWETNPKATRALIEAIWNAQVIDWENLDFNRHSFEKPMGRLWENQYQGGDVFFWGKGLTFLNAGSDMYYMAAMLTKLSGDKKPLVWAKRLAGRYVETRNPKTGIGGFQFSQLAEAEIVMDEKTGKMIRGDRAQYQYGDDFPGHLVYEGTLFMPYGGPARDEQICQMSMADALGEDGREFSRWAIEEIGAWGRVAYRKSDNSWIPMLTDGTSLEGYVNKKDGYFDSAGSVIKVTRASATDFWMYAMAYRISGDEFMWEMARNIAINEIRSSGAFQSREATRNIPADKGLGDIGADSSSTPKLNRNTTCASSEAIFGCLELYQKTNRKSYLDAACKVADNIIENNIRNGFFTNSKDYINAKFDHPAPLALLHLAAVLQHKPDKVPPYIPSGTFFDAPYGKRGELRGGIYRKKRS